MNSINTYRGTVYPWNCDHMGHMNVQFYIAKFDEASWTLLTWLGLSPTYLKENKMGIVALEQHVNYYKEVLAGDSIYIETDLIEIRDKTIIFNHRMFDLESKEMVSQTKITGLYIDAEIRKGVLFPLFVKEKLFELKKEITKT